MLLFYTDTITTIIHGEIVIEVKSHYFLTKKIKPLYKEFK